MVATLCDRMYCITQINFSMATIQRASDSLLWMWEQVSELNLNSFDQLLYGSWPRTLTFIKYLLLTYALDLTTFILNNYSHICIFLSVLNFLISNHSLKCDYKEPFRLQAANFITCLWIQIHKSQHVFWDNSYVILDNHKPMILIICHGFFQERFLIIQ